MVLLYLKLRQLEALGRRNAGPGTFWATASAPFSELLAPKGAASKLLGVRFGGTFLLPHYLAGRVL